MVVDDSESLCSW